MLDQAAAPLSLPDTIIFRLSPSKPEAPRHSHSPRRKHGAQKNPVPAKYMQFVEAVQDDGSSIGDYSTPGKDEGRRDSRCKMVTPTMHEEVNMQLVPIQEPLILSPKGSKRARITGSFSTTVTVSDHGVFDSRNGGGPVRGLYRNTDMHREQLIEAQMMQQAMERQAYEQAIENDDDEWASSQVKWGHDAPGLAKLIPKNNKGGQQLAALKPRHRDGIYVVKQELPVTPDLTPMDTDFSSREWQVQHSSSVTDANAIFNNIDSLCDALQTDSIFTDTRDFDLPRGRPLTRRGNRRDIHTSIMSSDAFDAALIRQSKSRPPPIIPTGSDIVREAEAMQATVIDAPTSTPAAFRDLVCEPLPLRRRSGKIASTRRIPPPLPEPVEGGANAHNRVGPANMSFLPEGRATDEVIRIVYELETERNELSAQNQALITALHAAHDNVHGGRAAYDALQFRMAGHMKELHEENAMLRSEITGKNGEVEFLQEAIAEKGAEIEKLRKQFEGELGEFFVGQE
jgi:hypothetical protein